MKRRSFLLRLSVHVSMMLGLSATQFSCKDQGSDNQKDTSPKDTDCSDLSGLTDAERTVRESFGYESVASISERSCRNCKLFLPPTKEKPCGSCLLFKGPVNEQGSCIQFAPKES
jgi:hypothetical protein